MMARIGVMRELCQDEKRCRRGVRSPRRNIASQDECVGTSTSGNLLMRNIAAANGFSLHMDDLLRRADAAICDSRWIRSEVRHSLAEARIAVAQVQRIVQCARAEKERANALVRASGATELKTRAASDRQSP
jgi:hypothetical protein